MCFFVRLPFVVLCTSLTQLNGHFVSLRSTGGNLIKHLLTLSKQRRLICVTWLMHVQEMPFWFAKFVKSVTEGQTVITMNYFVWTVHLARVYGLKDCTELETSKSCS